MQLFAGQVPKFDGDWDPIWQRTRQCWPTQGDWISEEKLYNIPLLPPGILCRNTLWRLKSKVNWRCAELAIQVGGQSLLEATLQRLILPEMIRKQTTTISLIALGDQVHRAKRKTLHADEKAELLPGSWNSLLQLPMPKLRVLPDGIVASFGSQQSKTFQSLPWAIGSNISQKPRRYSPNILEPSEDSVMHTSQLEPPWNSVHCSV